MTRPQSALTLLLFLALGAPPVLAHPKAVLKSSQASAAVGGKLGVVGERFGAAESYWLVLKGALSEYTLREMTADSTGAVSLDLAIPEGTRVGQYRLLAIASDGEEVAALDIAILADPAAEEGPPSSVHQEIPEGEHMEDAGAPEAVESIVPERRWSGAEWGVIGLVIGLAGGLGVTLLSGPRVVGAE